MVRHAGSSFNGIGVIDEGVALGLGEVTYKVCVAARVSKELARVAHRLAVVVHEHREVVQGAQVAIVLCAEDRLGERREDKQ